MTIGIIGLGLIGASYAKGLCGVHEVYGYDISSKPMDALKEANVIKGDALEHLSEMDSVILALNPIPAASFILQYGHLLKEGCLLTDVCGVKTQIINTVESNLKDTVSYLSHHPMSGNPEGGYENSRSSLFKGANLVYVKTVRTQDSDLNRLNAMLKPLGFKSFTVTNKTAHDHHIAHTSQLTHLISSALVLSSDPALPKELMGNSYKDLTRIADIEPIMWSELFMENKGALTATLDTFIETLNTYKTLLETHDQDAIQAFLSETRNRFKQSQ